FVNGGSGDDTFNVTPSPNAAIHVDGKSQVHADTLNYNTAGRTNIQIFPDHITANGGQTVFYTNIEVVNPPFVDDFNRPNSPNLRPLWTERLGQLAIVSQKAVSQAAVSVATANGVTLADAAVSATVTVPAVNHSQVGLLTRYAGPGDSHAYLGGVSFISGNY